MKKYDVIVIGSGSAGLSVALAMNKFGFQVLLVDKEEERIGGDCLNFGCIPSKALIHVAKEIHSAKRAAHFGLKPEGKVNLEKVMDYVRNRQAVIREHENKHFLQAEGVDVEIGEAHFTAKQEIEIGDKQFQAKKTVIATGSAPRILEFKGSENATILTNETVFNLSVLPENLVVAGGGPIGVELAQAFQRLGSNVSLVHKGKRLLEKELPEISVLLQKQLETEGLHIYTESEPYSFQDGKIELKGKHEHTVKCDVLLACVGRKLNHDSLQLEKAGIKTKDGKIQVKDTLQTKGNKHVYVAGDALGSLKFSHAAEMHARIILNNFFSPLKKKLSYKHFSWVTFTDPQVATFGLEEKQLKEAGTSFEKLSYNLKEDDRAITESYEYGKLIVYVTEKSVLGHRKILGGTLIAPYAGEIIQELVTCMVAESNLNVLFDKIYAYPVASRINQSLVVSKKAEELSAFSKKLLKKVF